MGRKPYPQHDLDVMVEPQRLRDGKLFQARVQRAFGLPAPKDHSAIFEHSIRHKDRGGRIDIFLRNEKDFAAVFEIKGTDRGRIKPLNVTRNLWSHQNQLMRCIDKFVEADKLNVRIGIIYPKAPRDGELRQRIETYLLDYGNRPIGLTSSTSNSTRASKSGF